MKRKIKGINKFEMVLYKGDLSLIINIFECHLLTCFVMLMLLSIVCNQCNL